MLWPKFCPEFLKRGRTSHQGPNRASFNLQDCGMPSQRTVLRGVKCEPPLTPKPSEQQKEPIFIYTDYFQKRHVHKPHLFRNMKIFFTEARSNNYLAEGA